MFNTNAFLVWVSVHGWLTPWVLNLQMQKPALLLHLGKRSMKKELGWLYLPPLENHLFLRSQNRTLIPKTREAFKRWESKGRLAEGKHISQGTILTHGSVEWRPSLLPQAPTGWHLPGQGGQSTCRGTMVTYQQSLNCHWISIRDRESFRRSRWPWHC